jgi:hypothetical protein
MPSLAISPTADNSIRKCLKIEVKKTNGIYLDFRKYVRLSRSCKQKEGGRMGSEVVLKRSGAQLLASRQEGDYLQQIYEGEAR